MMTVTQKFAAPFFVCIAVGFPEVAVSQVTTQDLKAGFEQNRQKVINGGIRVQLSRRSESNRLYQVQLRQLGLRDQLANPQSTKEQRETTSRQIQEMEKLISSLTATESSTTELLTQFWFRDPSVQIQLTSSDGGVPPNFEFAGSPATTQTLTTLFLNKHISWYSGDASGPVYHWKGAYEGVATSASEIPDAMFRFPPFIRLVGWPVSQIHVIDHLFEGEASEYQLIKTESTPGGSSVLIERKTELPNGSYLFPDLIPKWGSRIHGYNIQAVWVDLSRGCVPLRAEWSHRWYLDGAPYEPGGTFSKVLKRLDHVEIRELAGIGFYPVRGAIEHFADDLNAPEQALLGTILDEHNAEPVPDKPMVLYQTDSWNCVSIDRLPQEEVVSNIGFPEGTQYYDTRLTRTISVGNEELFLTMPQRPFASLLFIGNVIIAILVIAVLISLRVRSAYK